MLHTSTLIFLVVFIIVYGRMIEIYLLTSLAPIPLATHSNREFGGMGQNYFKSLCAIGFQGFLIMVCVAIYAVMVQSISATGGDIFGAIWAAMGYTLLLCFTLFKTGTLVKDFTRLGRDMWQVLRWSDGVKHKGVAILSMEQPGEPLIHPTLESIYNAYATERRKKRK